METVKLIKTVGGELYIGYVDDSKTTDSEMTMNQARNLSMQMTARGPSVAAMPIVPFAVKSPDSFTIQTSSILCSVDEANINKEILDGYKTEVTGIVAPSKPQIIV